MFDLEQAIAEWRKQLIVAGIRTPAPMDELESHFREEIERQMKLGSSPVLAFRIATREMGQAKRLRNEFAKTSRSSVQKKIIGVAAFFNISWCLLAVPGFPCASFHVASCEAACSF